MSQDFKAGDFLVFQIESGFAMMRVLGFERNGNDTTWHVSVYRDFYMDVESADTADPGSLVTEIEHTALTDRAFESTQVAFLKNATLVPADTAAFDKWKNDPRREVTDRSIRLLLGLR